jgi:hypothetical protein
MDAKPGLWSVNSAVPTQVEEIWEHAVAEHAGHHLHINSVFPGNVPLKSVGFCKFGIAEVTIVAGPLVSSSMGD